MANRILEFLSNVLKIGKEQLLLKGEFLRKKVPIHPVLGLTGLGVLLMAVRPLFINKERYRPEIKLTSLTPEEEQQQQQQQQHQESEGEYSLQKTLYLMREKEKLLRKQEAKQLQQ